MKGKVWNPHCNNPDKGFKWVDCVTGIEYEEKSLKDLPKEIRTNIIQKFNEKGYWVNEVKE